MTKIIDTVLHDVQKNIIHPETNISMVRGTNDEDKTLSEELTDIHTKETQIDEDISQINSNLSKLDVALTEETVGRKIEDAKLEELINQEKTDREAKDTELQTTITTKTSPQAIQNLGFIKDAGNNVSNYKGPVVDVSFVTALPSDASSHPTRLYLIPAS